MSSQLEALRQKIEEYFQQSHIPFRNRGERLSVRRGSSAVFVRPTDWTGQHTLVELLAPVLTGIDRSDTLLDRLNELNKSLYFGKAYWHDRGVWLAQNLLGDHIDRDELVAAVGVLGTVADKLDDELKAEFGGTRWIDS